MNAAQRRSTERLIARRFPVGTFLSHTKHPEAMVYRVIDYLGTNVVVKRVARDYSPKAYSAASLHPATEAQLAAAMAEALE